MKLALKVINNDTFVNALKSLVGQRMDSKAAFRLGKVMQCVERAVQDNKEEFLKIVGKYAEKNENGKYIPDGDGPKIPQEKVAEYEKEFETFLQREVEIPYKISLDSLKHTNLAPQEMMALDPIITELELSEA